jgi:two-component system nitrate/nitrite sensor histidine kinase NarX
LDINIQIDTERWREISPEQTIEILFIARESLTNVRKHAHANRVDVVVTNQADTLILTIADNGNGFDLDQRTGENGNGLRNMQERAQTLGGKIEFTNRKEGGTQVMLSVPQEK